MKNEPVTTFGTLGALVGALLAAALWQFAPDLGGDFIDALVALVVFLVPTVAGLWYARGKVTPVANPHDNDGQQLIPKAGQD